MDFVELTKRVDRDLYDSCDKNALPRLARAIERSKGLAGLLANNDGVLSPFSPEALVKLSAVYRQYESWKMAFRDTRKSLALSKLSLPDGSIQNTAFPHELKALERTSRMCSRAGYADLGAWSSAVTAHLDLWNACVEIAKRSATITVKMPDPTHPDAADFEALLFSKEKAGDVKNFKWLGARRGERAGVLSISIALPVEELESQTKARLPRLGLAAQKRDLSSILEELVSNNLESTIVAWLDQKAESEAIESASNAYRGLLCTAPLKTKKILGIWVGSDTAPIGAALLDSNGKLETSVEIPIEESVESALHSFVSSHSPDAAAIPVMQGNNQRLKSIEEVLESTEDIQIVRILPAGMREARQQLSALPPMVASAAVIALRALDPTAEWSKVSPASIGLGEYSSDISTEKLEAGLVEAKEMALWQQRTNRTGKGGTKADGVQKKRKRLNPLLKSIRDLKPGMTLDGVVTNLTKFGAFVNIGLATEAMIHVSQLSTDFIDEPSQVVRVGQTVSARVLEVAPEKNRIALSLKPEQADRPAGESAPSSPRPAVQSAKTTGARPQRGAPQRGDDKKSRHEALADLDALFKK